MYKHLSKDKIKFTELDKHQKFILSKASNYLLSFETVLLSLIDKRLVQTFYDAFVSIIIHLHHSKSLLLSELGQYICGPQHAPARTKRLSNLFRSLGWTSKAIDDEQLYQAKEYAQHHTKEGHRVLAFWDDSVVEKHESWEV